MKKVQIPIKDQLCSVVITYLGHINIWQCTGYYGNVFIKSNGSSKAKAINEWQEKALNSILVERVILKADPKVSEMMANYRVEISEEIIDETPPEIYEYLEKYFIDNINKDKR